MTSRLQLLVALMLLSAPSFAEAAIVVPNAGFETMDPASHFPEGWKREVGGEARAKIESDNGVFHSGSRSVRISNESPMKAFVFASFFSRPIPVKPSTTYILRFYGKAESAKNCFAAISFENDGDRRQYLPNGDFDWQAFSCQFTTPAKCKHVSIRFASDDVTRAFWVDDISTERASLQLTNLHEKQYPKAFEGVWPRSKGPVPEHLAVFDCRNEPHDVELAVAALEGIVNRVSPRLYVLNKSNPADYDEMWLRYMQEKGYTDKEERVPDLPTLLARFKQDTTGGIVYDPDLPGSVNAACMLAGIKNVLPVSPDLGRWLRLPIVEDLRGRWRRNVDAYRYVYENYWPQMNHHVLAWIHPLAANVSPRDYMTEFNVFCFWESGYADNEKGADPEAEEEFINELLANTPANIPVMGWPAYGDNKGVSEYTGVRWLSEYGKFVPGTEFCSNLSVHSAIHPDDSVFKQKSDDAPHLKLEKDKVYISCNILDSGDALWYWQLYQRKIWADPARGSVPIGWCMNVTLYDTLPLVMQWYYENATPNDTFFAAVSGLGYMNTQVYASRFRAKDRRRIWREYVQQTNDYCQKLDMHGIELYNGSWGEPTPPARDTFTRFTRGVKGLDFVLADLGRHNGVQPDKAARLLGTTAVFHTLTRFQVWSSSAEVARDDKKEANEWLLDEITRNSPNGRPGFMSAMAISWYYYPSWLKDLEEKLPPNYVLVGPGELARLFREYKRH